jgi:hypothetical protein
MTICTVTRSHGHAAGVCAAHYTLNIMHRFLHSIVLFWSLRECREPTLGLRFVIVGTGSSLALPNLCGFADVMRPTHMLCFRVKITRKVRHYKRTEHHNPVSHGNCRCALVGVISRLSCCSFCPLTTAWINLRYGVPLVVEHRSRLKFFVESFSDGRSRAVHGPVSA